MTEPPSDLRTFALSPVSDRPGVFEGTLPDAPIRPGTLTATWFAADARPDGAPEFVSDDGTGCWVDGHWPLRLAPPRGLVYAVDYTTGRCAVYCGGDVLTPPGVQVRYRVEIVDPFAPPLDLSRSALEQMGPMQMVVKTTRPVYPEGSLPEGT